MPKLSLKAITPKHLPSSKEYAKVIKAAVMKSARLVERDYEATTRTWSSKNKPRFDVTVDESGGDYSITAGTDSLLYKWTDEGTKPHIIRPRRSKFLRFRVGGRAKTTPNVIGSQAGSRGDSWRTADFVLHPGTRARNFTKRIKERRQKTVEQEISQGIAQVARKQS
jgi:hypothetical protein